jgi:predicted MFS family arabinose efflux permease
MDEAKSADDTAQVRLLTGSSCGAGVPTAPSGAGGASGGRRGWASVAAVALGAFIIVMTETLPVGLLPEIAGGLHVSLSLAGLMVLVPGLSAAVSAPLFFANSGRFDRRRVILALGLTILLSNVILAVAPSFILALVARLLFGATLGAFWTVVSPVGHTRLRDLAGVVARPGARFGMAAGAMVFIGQFTAWTYITPYLADRAELSSGVISVLYVLYGCGGIVGSLIAGSLFKRGVIASFAGGATVVAALVIALAGTGTVPWPAGLLFVAWGLFWGVVNPGTLVWILDAAPETPEAASAVNVANLQVAVALGSGLGAILVSSTTLQTVFLAAGFIILLSAALAATASRFVTLARRQ